MSRLTLTYFLGLVLMLAGLAPLAAAEFGDSSIIELESALAEQQAFVDFQAEELTAAETLHAERHAAHRQAQQYVAEQKPACFDTQCPLPDNERRNVAQAGAAGVVSSSVSSVLAVSPAAANARMRSRTTQCGGDSVAVDSSAQRLYFAIRNGYHGGRAVLLNLPSSSPAPARTRSLYSLLFFRTPFSGELT